MIVDKHNTVSITEKDFEEYHLYWHDTSGAYAESYADEFICRIYGDVDVAISVAKAISRKQCEYISYPVVVKTWDEWENEND